MGQALKPGAALWDRKLFRLISGGLGERGRFW